MLTSMGEYCVIKKEDEIDMIENSGLVYFVSGGTSDSHNKILPLLLCSKKGSHSTKKNH